MDNKEKSPAELLKEKLFRSPKNGMLTMDSEQMAKCDEFCNDYKLFLDEAKTEREAVDYAIEKAEKLGFTPFDCLKKYTAGDKVYYNNRGKALLLCTIGEKPLSDGIRINAAHIDSPRLDLKPNPLYENTELAFFKTHYYGGIKKYQWTAIPLALHGVVALKNGDIIKIKIGEDRADPQFCVTDLLPHLADSQQVQPMHKAIKGEDLNILIGSRPFNNEEGSDAVKLNILNILFEKYGITENDFQSAELELVPAFLATDIGFDRSLIGSYGHDDRVCAYTALVSAFEVTNPQYTSLTIFADKEETGSEGNTGMQSIFFYDFIADLARQNGLEARDILRKSKCLSADVNAAFDPTYPSVHETNNAAYINYGVVLTKYTGSRGKSSTNDASAEYMAYLRKLMDDNNVVWQTGELGKVDEGGGGTVAKYIANLDVDTVDLGVPVLSMHAPLEVVSKFDVYMTYKAFKGFFEDK